MIRRTLALLAALSIFTIWNSAAGADDALKRGGLFGARLGPVTDEVRREQKLEGGGSLVMDVIPGTAAEEAGFKAGDVITAVDGSKVAGTSEFVAAISRRKGGEKATLDFVRGARSQTKDVTLKPRPREPGNELFDVIYDSIPSRGGRLRTVVTRPKTPGKSPAFYLIQGLGGFSIESFPAGPGFYKPFIDDFARRGYVTFRVEKAGQGDSEGGPTRDVDFETELDGYRQGLKALAAYDFVDKDNIVIFGHSMGGVMAPLIAADAPVKGIAAYGTVAKTWYEYFAENTRRQSALEGRSASRIDEDVRKDAVIFAASLAGGKSPEEIASAHPDLKDRVNELFAEGKYLGGRHYLFFRQLAATNLPAAWEKFEGHALTMWGKAEYISTEADHALIASIVNKAHPGHGSFIAVEADHGFNKAATAEEAYRNALSDRPGEFNPVILATLRDWADKVAGRAGKGA